MFERYTEKARRVIFFARYEASQMGASAIDADHILLGLFREEKHLVVRFFSDPVSTLVSIRQEIESRHANQPKSSQTIDLPLTASAKNALQRAADASQRFSQNYIGPEHLLLGILEEEKSNASGILRERGLTADIVAAYVESGDPSQSAESGNWPGGVGYGVAAGIPETGTGLPPSAVKQLLSQFDAIVNVIVSHGHATPQELIDRIAGEQVMTPYIELRFESLLDLLIEKDIISEEEKREILYPES